MGGDGETMEPGRGSLKRSRADSEDHESTDDGLGYSESDWQEEEKLWNEDEEEDFGREQDIAEHQYTVSGDTARTVNIRLCLSDDDEFRWMKDLVAECTCDGVVVATATARYIQRERPDSGKKWKALARKRVMWPLKSLIDMEQSRPSIRTDPFTDVKKLKIERLRDALPLHNAASTLTDKELKDFFMAHADDKFGWDQVTTSESTLLHLTACKLKPLSMRWLLENVHHADTWKTSRDIHGYTPLEALQESLETMRTKKDCGSMVLNVSDEFRGYPDAAVSCLSLLSGRDTSGLDGTCLRYGCTCGECLGGFLSARMRSALIFRGEDKYDFIRAAVGDGRSWIMCNRYSLMYFDPDMLRNLGTNRSLRNGFVNMFQLAVECLEARKVPTVDNLERWCYNNQSEGAPDTNDYLQCAGAQMGCWTVLRVMFDAAKAEDETIGNGGV